MLFLWSIFCLRSKFAFFSTSYTITRKHSSRMHTACLLTRKGGGPSFTAPPFMEPHFRKKKKNPFTEPLFMAPHLTESHTRLHNTHPLWYLQLHRTPLHITPRMAPLPCEQTNTSENITFPQLRMRAVSMDSFLHIFCMGVDIVLMVY